MNYHIFCERICVILFPMKSYLTFFGHLIQIKNMKTGEPYPEADWHASYVGKCGLFSVWASENTAPGKYYVYFVPFEPGEKQRYFRSSIGDLVALGKDYTMTTASSQYTIVEDDDCIADADKIMLMFVMGYTK